MQIVALIFPEMDQLDLTGPFEVLARIPGARIDLVWKDLSPLRDSFGLILTPTATLGRDWDAVDVLLVPGGRGQVPLMEDEAVLAWIQKWGARARFILSVCTGALTLGAAGLLRGRRATTHWNSFEMLPHFGAIAEDSRVVVDSSLITTAGVSAGIDGSLRLAAMLAGDEAAQRIQLDIQYAPEPPFDAGMPATAPARVRESAEAAIRGTRERRRAIAVKCQQASAG